MALAPSRRAYHQPARAYGVVRERHVRRRLYASNRAAAGSPAPQPPRPRNLSRSSKPILPTIPPRLCLKTAACSSTCAPRAAPSTESHGRCLLQLWSDERNLVRTVVECKTARAMPAPGHAQDGRGQAAVPRTRPHQRPPHPHRPRRRAPQLSTTSGARAHAAFYRLQRSTACARPWISSTASDPPIVRGRLLKGTAADAVIGVGAEESASVIDGVLTLGILWLDYCRQHADARRHFGGLKVVVPAGAWRAYCRAHGLAQPCRRRFRTIHSRRAQ